VDASSSFYAEFDELIRARVNDWLDSLPVSSQEAGDE